MKSVPGTPTPLVRRAAVLLTLLVVSCLVLACGEVATTPPNTSIADTSDTFVAADTAAESADTEATEDTGENAPDATPNPEDSGQITDGAASSPDVTADPDAAIDDEDTALDSTVDATLQADTDDALVQDGLDTNDDAVDLADTSTTCVPAGLETCDGVDNDCDGLTDEGTCDDTKNCTKDWCDSGLGACQHDVIAGCIPDAKLPYSTLFPCGGLPLGWTLDTSLGAQTGPGWAVDGSPAKPGAKSGNCSLNFNNGTDYKCADDKPLSPQFGVFGAVHSRVVDARLLKAGSAIAGKLALSGSWQPGSSDKLTVTAISKIDGSSVAIATLDHVDTGTWKSVSLDLSAMAGHRFVLRIQFATTDCTKNDGTGPFVDDLAVFDATCSHDAGCNDNNPCTNDKCKAGKCVNNAKAVFAKCDDANPCTVSDKCIGGGCVGTAKVCNDGNDCTADTCEKSGKCAFSPLKATTGCDDGASCTSNDACDGKGACKATASKDGTTCDDGDVCKTADVCKSGVCAGTKSAPDGYGCSDDSGCTVGDACKAGKCVGVAAPGVCNDFDPCTNDTCEAGGGLSVKCKHAPANDGDTCDDGNACTTKEKCTKGKCGLGQGVSCNDANACTDDACDAKSGCQHTPNTKTCDDGQACSINDKCSNAKCQGTPKPCADGDPCTVDTCLANNGACKHNKISGCDSSPQKIPYATAFACGAAKDKNWTFSGGNGPVWKVDNAPAIPKARSPSCSLNYNNGTNYNCPAGKPMSATYGVSGTADSPRIDATAMKEGAPLRVRFYRSGRWTTGTNPDRFEVYAKKVTDKTWTKLGGLNHNANTTWAWTGYWLPKFAGSTFQVRLWFYTKDCSANALEGAFVDDFAVFDGSCKSDKNCNDNNPCTLNKCNVKTGWCEYPAAGNITCNDNNACTSNDKCVSKKCAGTAKKCTDGKACTADSCNTKTGACAFVAVKDGTACSDGFACTVADKCSKGACVSGKPTAAQCNDHYHCTADACVKSGIKYV